MFWLFIILLIIEYVTVAMILTHSFFWSIWDSPEPLIVDYVLGFAWPLTVPFAFIYGLIAGR